METELARNLSQQWEDFADLCMTVRGHVAERGMNPDQIWSDTHFQSKEIKDNLLAWRRQIDQFQCPLCHAGIGREFYSSAYSPIFRCPACGFPMGYLMLAT